MWPTSSAQAANVNFTVSGWYSPRASVASKALIAKQNELRLVTNASGQVGCQTHNGTDWQSAATSTSALVVGSWKHVACAYDGVNLRVYIDGVEEAKTALTANVQNTANNMRLGSDATAAYGDYNGYFDEVKVYNFALNMDEIAVERNLGRSGKFGSIGTESDGVTPSDSASREYCVPGDTSTCRAPVGEWRMDEKVSGDSKTLRDTSGNGNNGTTVDGANNTGMDCAVRGKIGGACEFDGVDDYVDINKSVVKSGNKTISAWVKPSSSWTLESGYIMANYTPSSQGYSVLTNVSDKTVGIAWNSIANTVQTTEGLLTDKWTHVTAVFSSGAGGGKIYFNGINKASGNLGTEQAVAQDDVIGARWEIYQSSQNREFNGLIDDVRIYDYARTPAQVAWEYNRGAPVGWWSFDECSGTTVYDKGGRSGGTSTSSGNKNHGTITIGATGTNTAAGTCNSGNSSHAWANGKTGKRNASLDFDGTDDVVTVTNATAIDLNNALVSGFSIGAWIYANTDGEGDVGEIIDKGSATFMRVDSEAGGKLDLQASLDLATADATLNIAGALTTNTWHYVVMTWTDDGDDEISLWVDGVLKGTSTDGNGAPAADTNNLLIGGSSTANFDGQIDEVKIWNYALTPAQIEMEYGGGAVRFGPETGSP